jgi:uncharacterized protein (TIGR02145 family)
MKKLITLLFIIHCSLFIAFSQAPNQFKYQVVVRDGSGILITGQTVYFRISILKGGIAGTVSYSEEQQTQTNQFGLANLNIGNGTNQQGSIGSIDWGADTYFLKIEYKQTSGGTYQEMGKSQLLSVPYSLYSNTAGSIGIPGIIGQTLFHNGEMWTANSTIFNDGTNVGIGTRKPNYKLHINGTAKANTIQLGSSVGPIQESWWEFGVDNNNGAGIDFHTHTTGSTDYDARIYREPGDDGNFNIFNFGNGNLYLGANNSPSDIVVTANHNVGIGTTTPQAKLDISSVSSGFLPPRMTTAQMNAIASPVEGLTIYNTDKHGLCFYYTRWNCIGVNELQKIYSCGNIYFDPVDNNYYNTVLIDTQCWMAENLKTTHYSNGDDIPNVTDNTQWINLSTGAYCDYNNNANNSAVYGRLYNWFTVNDSRKICPSGWHVPEDWDWTTLTNYLGGLNVAGGKMKEAGYAHWQSPNTGADNSSGFTALPGGSRYNHDGSFGGDLGSFGYFWSSTEVSATYARHRYLTSYLFGENWYDYYKTGGCSVRCLKD